MKIYSTFRHGAQKGVPGNRGGGPPLGFLRSRRLFGTRWRFKNLKVLGSCLLVMVAGFALLGRERFSFAYNTPLNDTLLVQPGVLSVFQSVPLTDPDEYEPDSMDRIEEVVEELKSATATFTRKELRYTRYKVQPGDSVWDIARKNGIRSGTLIWTNADVLSNPKRLPAGKEILIPNMDAIEVRLKSGDNVWTLARRFSVGHSEILKFNLLNDTKKLKPGAKLYIPNPNFDLQSIPRVAIAVVDGFLWPGSYRHVNSGFGFRLHPIRKRRIFHEGIDIGGGRGSTVYASADGRVSFVGWMRGYGKIIVIRHKDGVTTRYAHLSSTRVTKGQRLEQGQIIGGIGATGLATGPNLHFEVRKNGLPQDPLTYLRRR